MKLEPMKDRLIIKPVEAEEKVGLLYIPEDARDRPLTGVVDSVGDEVEKIEPGDTVMYGKYSGTDVELEKEAYVVLREDDIIAIIRD